MRRVDLNVDIGEGFPYDTDLLEFATSANVCCGEHSGSWDLTLSTIELCLRKGIRLGMHPGFPDRASMGRRIPEAKELDAYCKSVNEQSRAFCEVADPAYIKPHGAWYNLLTPSVANADKVDGKTFGTCAGALFGMVLRTRKPAMLLPVCPAAMAIRATGGAVLSEGFADRAYLPDGTLKPRTEPGAVLEDPQAIRYQVLRLAETVDSICLHGDTPGCLEFAEMVRKSLEDAGFEVAP